MAEVIAVLCLVKKDPLKIPTQPLSHPIDGQILDKVNKFTQTFAKDIPSSSPLYRNFFHFVVNYYNNTMDNCIYYLDWFVKDSDYTSDVELECKIPPILSKKSIILILKFLILQIKAQIKTLPKVTKPPSNPKKGEVPSQTHSFKRGGSTTSSEVPAISTEGLTEMIELIISIYINTYKRQDLVTCTYIMIYLLVIARCPDHFLTVTSLNLSDYRLIQPCSLINLVYQQIQQSTGDVHKSTKTKGKGRKIEQDKEFFQDPKNQEYLRLINDSSLIQDKPPPIQPPSPHPSSPLSLSDTEDEPLPDNNLKINIKLV
jgi:hypothetical protein